MEIYHRARGGGRQRMKITGTLQHSAWSGREMPPVERVRPGLWSVPVPIPHNPLRYTLVYVVESGSGIALVDAGWSDDDTWRALLDGLAQTGHTVADVRGVLVTHTHMDHLGLAGRVREASGCWVGMHPAEARELDRNSEMDGAARVVAAWRRHRGVPSIDLDMLAEEMEWWRRALPALARPDLLISDGDRPLGPAPGIRALWTPGHTPGHLCFVDEARDVIFTGDHVLPRISPNISLPPGRTGEPLGDFLASLAALIDLEPAEVLPAHEYRFSGLAARCEALLEHHRARLSEAEAVVRESPGLSTWDVAARLTWSRPWVEFGGMMQQSALGEAYTHLLHLEARHRVANVGDGRDAWHPAEVRDA